jgi:group I intron endonuclease
MNSGIYCIENLINGKKYIGQALNLGRRMKEYHKGCYALNNAIKKYSKKNFRASIVLFCEPNELDYYEESCINIFNSYHSKRGYNLTFGGNGSKGHVHREETKRKLSIAMAGKNHPLFGKKGTANPNFGKKEGTLSKYFGVYKQNSRKGKYFYSYWAARIKVEGKFIYIGIKKSEIEAAILRDEYVKKHELSYPLNFPE